MRFRATVAAAAFGALAGPVPPVGSAPPHPGPPRHPVRFEFAEPHMGTTFRIVLFAGDTATAVAGAEAAFAVVAALDTRLSDWDPDSELSRLAEIAGSGAGRRVSPELWHALSLAKEWARRTDGAFDPTVGPLTRLWRWSARRGELPDSTRLAAARAAVGWWALRLERGGCGAPDGARAAEAGRSPAAHGSGGIVHLDRPGMVLDLGGIAKGIAADAALAELARRGLRAALVDAGGDLALGNPPSGKAGWRVVVGEGRGEPGIEVGREAARAGEESGDRNETGALMLSNVGVATSGARFRYLEADGVRYSHIVDPRTGLGLTRPRSVTVIAPDATTADVLASALSVMDGAAGRALVASVPGARVVAGAGPPRRPPAGSTTKEHEP